MAKSEKPSPRVEISARNLRDVIRDELYGLGGDAAPVMTNETIKTIAKTIVKRALLSPR